MVIYEVNITINEFIYDEFLSWLKIHVAEMDEIDGIISGSEIFHEIENKLQVSVHYKFLSQKLLDQYIKNNAPSMRGRLPDHFKEHLVFSRRCLSKLSN
jgi:hypothetical protein